MTAPPTPAEALDAADVAPVAVFAFRDARGRPAAVPVTPYVDREAGRIVVTSTLAYIRKAEHVRRDGRVALVAGGVHVAGVAAVRADVSGDVFVARYLAQELRKYPPGRALVKVPLHRRVFSWYFGRAIISMPVENASSGPGDDASTVITLDDDGFPRITPIAPPPEEGDEFPVSPAIPDGPALVLVHRESPDMSDLRHVSLRGEVVNGAFRVRSRAGTLDVQAPDGGEIERQKRGRRARKIMKEWEQA